MPSRYRINWFHCALALCRVIEDLCGYALEWRIASSPRCHEDEFSDGCANVGAIMTIQRSCWRELHHCHICQIQNGLLGATVTWKWAWKSELVDALVT